LARLQGSLDYRLAKNSADFADDEIAIDYDYDDDDEDDEQAGNNQITPLQLFRGLPVCPQVC
jgi:hypothetical protein